MRLAITIFCFAMMSHAAVKIDKTPYKGWPNSYRVSNGEVELVVTSDIGPRVIRYGFAGGQNLFWNDPKTLGKTGGNEWQLIGGHRLWHAPEDPKRTYAPDNGPVEVKIEGSALHAIQPIEPTTGIQKEIIVRLADRGSSVEVLHRLTNKNLWAIELSP